MRSPARPVKQVQRLGLTGGEHQAHPGPAGQQLIKSTPSKVKSNHVDDNESFSYFRRNSTNLELNLSLTPKASQ